MATVPSNMHSTPQPPGDGRSDKQLRRDRIIAVLVILGLLAFMALMIWLANLSGSAPSNTYYDYWLMP